jgi:hypothetical protein
MNHQPAEANEKLLLLYKLSFVLRPIDRIRLYKKLIYLNKISMSNLYKGNDHKPTQDDLGLILVTVNASIEKQIEQIKEEVSKFTDFLAEIKNESPKN